MNVTMYLELDGHADDIEKFIGWLKGHALVSSAFDQQKGPAAPISYQPISRSPVEPGDSVLSSEPFAAPLKVVKLVETCAGCPAQWDAWTDADEYLYIRYRGGKLTVSKEAGNTNDTILSCHWGEPLDGFMTVEELKEVTKGILDLELV